MIKKHYNQDGTAVYYDDQRETAQIPSGFPTIQLVTQVDDLTAIQLGVAQILDNIEFKSVDRRSMILNNKKESGMFKFGKIYLDYPDPEDPVTPEKDSVEQSVVSALIRADGETKFEPEGNLSGSSYLEDTLNVYSPGTLVRRYGKANTSIIVDCLIPNKDDRASVRRTLVEAFSAEPDDHRHSRHVIIKNYYDAVAQYTLQSIYYTGDNPDDAQARLFGLHLTLNAQIPTLGLVKAPAIYMPKVGIRMQNSDDCLT